MIMVTDKVIIAHYECMTVIHNKAVAFYEVIYYCVPVPIMGLRSRELLCVNKLWLKFLQDYIVQMGRIYEIIHLCTAVVKLHIGGEVNQLSSYPPVRSEMM